MAGGEGRGGGSGQVGAGRKGREEQSRAGSSRGVKWGGGERGEADWSCAGNTAQRRARRAEQWTERMGERKSRREQMEAKGEQSAATKNARGLRGRCEEKS
eukprot:5042662-Pleurochrysis_carterae.AAC.1